MMRGRRASLTVGVAARTLVLELTPDPADLRGAERLLVEALALPHQARLLLIIERADAASRIGAALLTASESLGIEPTVFLFDPRAEGTEEALRLMTANASGMDAIVSIVAAPASIPGLLALTEQSERVVLIDASSEAASKQALRCDLDELHRLGKAVASRLEKTIHLTLHSGLGELLELTLDLTRAPLHHGGRAEARAPLFLPSGRVTADCLDVEGTITVDGGVFLPDGTGVARGAISQITIRHGHVQKLRGPAAELLGPLFDAEPARSRVSAIGFGTNTSLVASVGAPAVDLCLPGAHLVLGGPKHAPIYLVPRRPELRSGSEVWMVRGRWARDLVG